MKKAFCCVLFCAWTLAADSADFTAGMSNGRGWRKFPNEMKIAYIAGIYDAAKVLSMICKEAGFLGGTTTGQTVQALDGFYTDGLNGSITVVGAMRYLERKSQGATEEELRKMISDLRAGG